MSKDYGILAIISVSLLWGTTGTAATFSPSLSPSFIGALLGIIGMIMLYFSDNETFQNSNVS